MIPLVTVTLMYNGILQNVQAKGTFYFLRCLWRAFLFLLIMILKKNQRICDQFLHFLSIKEWIKTNKIVTVTDLHAHVLNFNTIRTNFAEIRNTSTRVTIGISSPRRGSERVDVDIDASSGSSARLHGARLGTRSIARRSIELKGFRACKRLRPTARRLTGSGPKESFPPHKG